MLDGGDDIGLVPQRGSLDRHSRRVHRPYTSPQRSSLRRIPPKVLLARARHGHSSGLTQINATHGGGPTLNLCLLVQIAAGENGAEAGYGGRYEDRKEFAPCRK